MFILLITLFTFFHSSWSVLKFSIEPPNLITLNNNTGANIGCSVTSDLKVTTKWINYETQSPVEDIIELRHQRPDGSLYFAPFDFDQFRADIHSAKYQCVGSNKHGVILSRIVQVQAGNCK